MEANKTNNLDEVTAEENGAQDTLSPRKVLAIQALLSHPTQKEAALAAGISETTLWRYMKKDEDFKRGLREAGNYAVSHAALRLQRASGDAVTVLEEVMRDKEVSASARIAAAKVVYDNANRAVENNELASRIEEMEEFLRARQDEDAIAAATKER
jgi:hypothetical protein